MKYIINDKKYHFKSAFDTETGAYVRTGILDENGRDTGVDPFMASFPHLIDVGVMVHPRQNGSLRQGRDRLLSERASGGTAQHDGG